jgi:hypothetical protein
VSQGLGKCQEKRTKKPIFVTFDVLYARGAGRKDQLTSGGGQVAGINYC